MKAVILFSMGGPDSLNEVRPFLYRLFSDPAILRLPSPLRQALAFTLSFFRASKARCLYEKMGGFSPLKRNSLDQLVALERRLAEKGDYRCFLGMSYSAPFIAEAVNQALETNPEEIILLPLYPQYSTTTTASVLRDALKALKRKDEKTKIKIIDHFYNEEGFLAAMAAQIRALYEQAQKHGDPFVLFSAHGLPEHIVKAGDPYPKQCEATAAALAQHLCLPKDGWGLCYQSKVGPLAWIGPSTLEIVEREARQKRPLLVVPIAFVSEHVETLVEIGLFFKKRALEEGCPFFAAVPTVGTHPLFIQALADKIEAC